MVPAPSAPLAVRDLTKRYGPITAVSDLTFSAERGVVTGFVGANGAGKSTTLRMIMGLDRPTAGVAQVHGRPIRRIARPMRVVGAMLDARAVHPRRSGWDHLCALARVADLPSERVRTVLEMVELQDAATRRAGDYSLGMKQRLGIAAALLGDPDVVILDEPLNGLDPEGIRWARSLMRTMAAQGRTVLFSSHLMTEMELTADHLVVIHRGRLLADAPLGELMDARSVRCARVRTPAPDDLRPALVAAGLRPERRGDVLDVPGATASSVGRVAARAGIEVSELTETRDTLEDVVIAMTRAATVAPPEAC